MRRNASALVDLLAGTDRASAVRAALGGTVLHAPAHLDAEILSALGRLQRAGLMGAADVDAALAALARAPISRHPLADLLRGAWQRRDDFQLADALYVELSERTGYPVLTTDERLRRRWPATREVGSTG